MKTAIGALLLLAGIASVTAWWDDYQGMTDERVQDLMKETNRWDYNQVPLNRNGEDNQSVQIPTEKRGGFAGTYHAGYGYFRGRRAATDLQGQEYKWRTYHRIRPANMQIQSHHMSSAQKPEKKKSGFPPYRAGYGYFRGRRAATDLQGQEYKWRTYHRIRPANLQSQSHHMSSAKKPEKKKSGFSPYRAGYGYFRGRRATV